MIRKVRKFVAFGKEFLCGDMTVEWYIHLIQEPVEWAKKILLEFNKKEPELDGKRLLKLYDKIIRPTTQPPQHKEDAKKNKSNDEKQGKDDILKEFHILEGSVMVSLHQPLSEIRSWTLEYFMKIVDDLDVILGQKKLKDKRNANKPDRGKLKSVCGDFYNNK